jgi:glycosyltransferase involved in cell wall biosynthesis
VKVGFVTGRMSSTRDGNRFAQSGLSRLVHALRDRADLTCVATSAAPSFVKEHDTLLEQGDARFVPLPFIPSTISGLGKGAECRRGMARIERLADVVIVQLPFSPPWGLMPRQRPRVYHACADVPGVVSASKYYRGARRIAALGFAEFMHAWQNQQAHQLGARVVTNGDALHERMGRPPGRSIVSSSLGLAEVGSVKRQRPANAPFRILFCGYLRPEKGLDTLIAAYRSIVKEIPDAELVVVGDQDLGQGGAVAELRRQMDGAGSVDLKGLIAFGPKLFREFADADVLLLPSRSEGTPRVLVEARAFGCPVVASRVGGIPTSVSDGVDGFLVPPDDALALAQATLRIARAPTLRARLIEHGYERARQCTVEALAEALLEEASSALADDR